MRAFVFDLDGTLLDTLFDIGAACNAVLGRHGYPQHPLPAYKEMVGNGFDKLMERALPDANALQAEAFKSLAAEARARYAEHMMEETKPYTGMAETLLALARRGCQLAVLSNKPDTMSVRLIPYYYPHIPFAFIRGATAEIPLKPDAKGLTLMLEQMKVPKTQSCYVGDSNVDMLTARNAGIPGIGCAWGFRGAAELKAAGAAKVIERPDELLDIWKAGAHAAYTLADIAGQSCDHSL